MLHKFSILKAVVVLTLLCLFSSNVNSQITLPGNMYADTAHAPFWYGVASGDPTTSSVMLWTHIRNDQPQQPTIDVNWEVATDEQFTQIATSGTFTTSMATDWTVKPEATGLNAGTIYYYRFEDGSGNYSVVGRTKTAPSAGVSKVRFAVASCSSIFSGYFNAYGRIAELNDIDLVIHLGDYIYEFIDEDERIRIPTPELADPSDNNTVQEWRDQHKYYLLDPDLRAARQMHPWTVMWDNHDAKRQAPAAGVQAEQEYTANREYFPSDTVANYRTLKYGGLVDVIMLDMQFLRGDTLLSGTGQSILGNTQETWFYNELANSTAKWRIIGSQKMFGRYFVGEEFPMGSNGFFSTNAWDGFPESRNEVLDQILLNDPDNNIFISGDSHISYAADIPRDPTNDTVYIKETGEGSLAVEFLPTSISRGNFDEFGIGQQIIDILIDASLDMNPNHFYMEGVQHGYGIMEINADSTIAQYYYSEILQQTNVETKGQKLVVMDGDNHWKRGVAQDSAVSVKSITIGDVDVSDVYPNPVTDVLNIDVDVNSQQTVRVDVFQLTSYKSVKLQADSEVLVSDKHTFSFQAGDLPAGAYLIQIVGEDFIAGRRWIKATTR